MALIPKTNIATGNTILASDITNIINSLNETGSYTVIATGSFTGSFIGLADSASYALSSSYSRSGSYAVSASYALSSSYALSGSYAVSASYALSGSFTISSSYASASTSASYALSSSYAVSSSYAATASYAKLLNIPTYIDNAAAVSASLPVGALYRNGDFLMIVH